MEPTRQQQSCLMQHEAPGGSKVQRGVWRGQAVAESLGRKQSHQREDKTLGSSETTAGRAELWAAVKPWGREKVDVPLHCGETRALGNSGATWGKMEPPMHCPSLVLQISQFRTTQVLRVPDQGDTICIFTSTSYHRSIIRKPTGIFR